MFSNFQEMAYLWQVPSSWLWMISVLTGSKRVWYCMTTLWLDQGEIPNHKIVILYGIQAFANNFFKNDLTFEQIAMTRFLGTSVRSTITRKQIYTAWPLMRMTQSQAMFNLISFIVLSNLTSSPRKWLLTIGYYRENAYMGRNNANG